MVATAIAAAPSPRPTKPMPSPVVALTLTRVGRDAERLGEPLAHRVAVRRELRALQHDRGVDVADREAARAQLGDHGAQQRDRVGAFYCRVRVGEVLADVAEPGGAEQRVDDRRG